MDFNTLLLIDPDKGSTKSFILRCIILVGEITIPKLKSMLKRDFNKSISYQAIRKILLELIYSGVVIKNDKVNSFAINKVWVLKLRESLTVIEKSLSKHKIKSLSEDTSQIKFKNLNDLGFFVLFGLENKYFSSSKDDETFMYVEHLWIPFSNLDRRNTVMNLFKENKVKILTKYSSIGDKILLSWYKKCTKVKLNVKMKSSCQYIVRGNTVIQIYMDKELKNKMNQLYSFKSIIKLNLFQELIDMTNKNYNIEVIITKNKKIAEQIREDMKKYL